MSENVSGPGLSVSVIGFTYEGNKYEWYDLAGLFLPSKDSKGYFTFFKTIPVGATNIITGGCNND